MASAIAIAMAIEIVIAMAIATAIAMATATAIANATSTATTAEFYNRNPTRFLNGTLPDMLKNIVVRLLCRDTLVWSMRRVTGALGASGSG